MDGCGERPTTPPRSPTRRASPIDGRFIEKNRIERILAHRTIASIRARRIRRHPPFTESSLRDPLLQVRGSSSIPPPSASPSASTTFTTRIERREKKYNASIARRARTVIVLDVNADMMNVKSLASRNRVGARVLDRVDRAWGGTRGRIVTRRFHTRARITTTDVTVSLDRPKRKKVRGLKREGKVRRSPHSRCARGVDDGGRVTRRRASLVVRRRVRVVVCKSSCACRERWRAVVDVEAGGRTVGDDAVVEDECVGSAARWCRIGRAVVGCVRAPRGRVRDDTSVMRAVVVVVTAATTRAIDRRGFQCRSPCGI